MWCRERRVDALWTDVPPLRHARAGERTGFPTQKPRALLDRIVACASPPGGLVVDVFAGSGTTGESAHALGRRFVLGDASPLALATARARLLRAGVPLVGRARAAARGEPARGRAAAGARRADAARDVRVDARASRASRSRGRSTRARREARPFRRRVALGARARGAGRAPAAREATLERARAVRSRVRVWYDDGRVGTQSAGGPP